MTKKIIFSIISISFLLSSCKKDNLPTVGGTAAQKMANEWWVYLSQGGTDLTGYNKISTYNTASGNTDMWLDDMHHLWDFKVKVNADFNALSFNATQAVSVVEGYDIKVTVTDGKVLIGQGHSKTGNITDSIYMKVEFEDDPGTEYIISGHARTKFIEDEY